MKTFSLLRAILSQDMNLFKYSTKENSSKIKKILLPIILFFLVSFSIGSYAFVISSKLAPLNLTYIMLSMFIFMVVILTFMQGIYKSQGILFETKDNDLLFSLPISKGKILFARIFKLLLFEYLYNLMFLLPAFVAYIYYTKPGISFYIISVLMTILIPIIPTIISSFIGYLVKLFSSKSNNKKIVQTILSIIVFMAIFFLSTRLDSFMNNIVLKAKSINEILTKIYYPIGLYVNLISNFNLLDLIKLLLINIIPLLLFILLCSRLYFKIISSSKSYSKKVKKSKGEIYIQRKPLVSLTIKELKRYFYSPVYMFNTSFGLFLAIVISVLLCIKGKGAFDSLLEAYGDVKNISINTLYYGLILFSTLMTSITSSSISLEGKTINITKSLPIKEKDILNSKIIYSCIIELPFILISEIIFFIAFKPSIFYMASIFIMSIITIFLQSVIGLIVNLKYPKMNATNDTEVIKQSMSSTISVFIGMSLFIISILAIVHCSEFLSIEVLILIHLLLIGFISGILYKVLMKYGIDDYKKINV